MKLEILISCMHQHDMSIVERSCIYSDALIINQCDENKYEEKDYGDYRVRMISTTERGLSKSRNMAIRNSIGDICLLCDDDEVFREHYLENVLKAFAENKNADVLIFNIANTRFQYNYSNGRMWYLGALRVTSAQIAFRKEKILTKNILFDEKMGSGTGNGGGEENKFLFDCIKQKLKIYYSFQCIATKKEQVASVWFHGFTKEYFQNRGWSVRQIMGLFFAMLYIIEFSIVKYHVYKKDCSFLKALKYQIRGLFDRR